MLNTRCLNIIKFIRRKKLAGVHRTSVRRATKGKITTNQTSHIKNTPKLRALRVCLRSLRVRHDDESRAAALVVSDSPAKMRY
jgi:hypothetical protein